MDTWRVLIKKSSGWVVYSSGQTEAEAKAAAAGLRLLGQTAVVENTANAVMQPSVGTPSALPDAAIGSAPSRGELLKGSGSGANIFGGFDDKKSVYAVAALVVLIAFILIYKGSLPV